MASAKLADGEGGLKKVVLEHPSGASAEIYLWGATLTSFKSPGGKENIFVSPGAIFDGKKAIRGGVPVVFPQFGQPDKAMPQHGVARINTWEVSSMGEAGAGDAAATFTLRDGEATRAMWPHAFELEYLVELKEKSLTMTLRVTNSGDEAWPFQALLHTYFAVSDVGDVMVEGLRGHHFEDKVTGAEAREEAREQIDLPSFTDSVYLGKDDAPKEVRICAKAGGSPLYATSNAATIAEAGQACDIVVWNPFEEKSPGDLPPPAFKSFVCVEPGLVGKAHDLAPKAAATLSQTIVPLC